METSIGNEFIREITEIKDFYDKARLSVLELIKVISLPGNLETSYWQDVYGKICAKIQALEMVIEKFNQMQNGN